MLHYSIDNADSSALNLPPAEDAQKPAMLFSIDSVTGEIFGEADLLAGTYRFNISVTDGKYVTKSVVVVDVSFLSVLSKRYKNFCSFVVYFDNSSINKHYIKM